MLQHNDWCTSLYYVEESLYCVALQGWHDIQSAKVVNLLSATGRQCHIGTAHLVFLQYCEDECCFLPESWLVDHLSNTYVCRVCGRIKLTLLRVVLACFGMSHVRLLFHMPIEADWANQVHGLLLRYGWNILLDSILIKFQNGQLFYSQPFYSPTSLRPLDHNWTIGYPNAIRGIMPQSNNF